MIQEYRCARCNHLSFKGSLQLLLTKQYDDTKDYIELQCDKCGLINRFYYETDSLVIKRTSD